MKLLKKIILTIKKIKIEKGKLYVLTPFFVNFKIWM